MKRLGLLFIFFFSFFASAQEIVVTPQSVVIKEKKRVFLNYEEVIESLPRLQKVLKQSKRFSPCWHLSFTPETVDVRDYEFWIDAQENRYPIDLGSGNCLEFKEDPKFIGGFVDGASKVKLEKHERKPTQASVVLWLKIAYEEAPVSYRDLWGGVSTTPGRIKPAEKLQSFFGIGKSDFFVAKELLLNVSEGSQLQVVRSDGSFLVLNEKNGWIAVSCDAGIFEQNSSVVFNGKLNFGLAEIKQPI